MIARLARTVRGWWRRKSTHIFAATNCQNDSLKEIATGVDEIFRFGQDATKAVEYWANWIQISQMLSGRIKECLGNKALSTIGADYANESDPECCAPDQSPTAPIAIQFLA